MSVDDAWNSIVVDVTAFTKNVLNCGNSLLFSFVSKHGSFNNVADTVNVWLLGLPVIVSRNNSSLVCLKSSLFKLESASECVSADRNEGNVAVNCDSLVLLVSKV